MSVLEPEMSVCVTVGQGKEEFVDGFIDTFLSQDYDLRQLELCVTYAPQAKDILNRLKPHVEKFYQIKVAQSDRSKLPFVIPENNPACDINSQICNVATAEKIVRTDFEMRFTNRQSLNYISNKLERPSLCVVLPSWHVNEKFQHPGDFPRVAQMSAPMGVYTFVCSSFRRSEFFKCNGIDEKFALGFAADDSYFHLWWKKNQRLIFAVMGYVVIHLWHGNTVTDDRLKLRDSYTLPLYRDMLAKNVTPNAENPDWHRPEMISEVEIWKA